MDVPSPPILTSLTVNVRYDRLPVGNCLGVKTLVVGRGGLSRRISLCPALLRRFLCRTCGEAGACLWISARLVRHSITHLSKQGDLPHHKHDLPGREQAPWHLVPGAPLQESPSCSDSGACR